LYTWIYSGHTEGEAVVKDAGVSDDRIIICNTQLAYDTTNYNTMGASFLVWGTSTTGQVGITGTLATYDSSVGYITVSLSARWKSATAIDGLRLYTTAGHHLLYGRVSSYGLKQS
jgi:hypothetical protein